MPGGDVLDPKARREEARWFYEQNLVIANIFFDWRHKLLTLGVGAASALVAASVALQGNTNRYAAAGPAFLGLLIATAVGVVNERFASIMTAAYRVCVQLEDEVIASLKLDDPEFPGQLVKGPFAVLTRAYEPPSTKAGTARTSWPARRYRRTKERIGASLRSFTQVIRWLSIVVVLVCFAATVWTLVSSEGTSHVARGGR